MSPSNRTAERLRALEKAVAAGKLSPDKAAEERARLEKHGASWEARWTLSDGKSERFKTFSETEHGKKAKRMAEDYEREQKLLVQRGEGQDHQFSRATIARVLDYYLAEKMHLDGEPRESFKNARAHRKNILAIWGDRFTLEALDADPEPHMKKLKRELMKKFPGGHWNNKVTLKAALAYWIRRKRLRILNPVDIIDWPQPDNARKERFSWDQHRKNVTTARGPAYPAWLPTFFESGWETGWRSGEIQDWHIERLHLNPTGEDFPWVLTLIEKQGEEEPVYEEKPITWRLAGLLRALIGGREEGPLWPRKRTATDRWVRRVLNEAGHQGKRFHDYRRSMKKRLEDAGVAPRMADDYVGHGEEMGDRYKTRQREDFEAALRKLEPDHIRTMEKGNG